MLPRDLRLHRRQDIEQVVRHGSRVVTPLFVIYWQRSDTVQSPRVACVVGKKVHKLAVRRHRLQRLLRALASEVIPNLQDSMDMVWVGQPQLATVEKLEQVRQSIVSYRARLPFKDSVS